MSDERVVRVAILDVWTDIPITASGDTSVAMIKSQALAAARVTEAASAYEVKFRGAALADETQTLVAAGVPSGGALIVMPRRRRPVR